MKIDKPMNDAEKQWVRMPGEIAAGQAEVMMRALAAKAAIAFDLKSVTLPTESGPAENAR